MQITLGIILGIVISALVFTILAYFRAGIEKRVKVIETKLAGQKQKGAIFLPESDDDIARNEFIKAKHERGEDVSFEELL